MRGLPDPPALRALTAKLEPGTGLMAARAWGSFPALVLCLPVLVLVGGPSCPAWPSMAGEARGVGAGAADPRVSPGPEDACLALSGLL